MEGVNSNGDVLIAEVTAPLPLYLSSSNNANVATENSKRIWKKECSPKPMRFPYFCTIRVMFSTFFFPMPNCKNTT